MRKTLIATVAATLVVAAASSTARDRDVQDVFVVKESTEIPTVVVSGSVVPSRR